MSGPKANPGGERITTSVARLEEIVRGGLPLYWVVLVAGLPGTGKTILAEQALFANAAHGRTSLYLSTISEPVIKVLRFLQGFSFFRIGSTINGMAEMIGGGTCEGTTTLISGGAGASKTSLARRVSIIADNAVSLRYLEVAGEIKRTLGVLKMRGSRHDVRLHELNVVPPKVSIGAPVTETGLTGGPMQAEVAKQPETVLRGAGV